METQPHSSAEHRAPPLLNSISAAAFRLAVSRSKIYLMISDGTLSAVKVGGRTMVPEASLQGFVASLPAASIGAGKAAAA